MFQAVVYGRIAHASTHMKYRFLLKFLRLLVQVKRFAWWCGAQLGRLFGNFFKGFWHNFSWVHYKITSLFERIQKRLNIERFLKRDFLQIVFFILLLIIAWPQTRLAQGKDLADASQKTTAYALWGGEVEYTTEEVSAMAAPEITAPSWRAGVVGGAPTPLTNNSLPNAFEPTLIAGGSALLKPIIVGGAKSRAPRLAETEYQVEAGDSLGGIAYEFGVSIATILWENNLGLKSIIRPGDILKIPPATGVMHTVKKRDTIKSIARVYGATSEEIIVFNRLKPDGTDLIVGDRIMVPNGVKPENRALARVGRTTPSLNRVAIPPGSSSAPSVRGFVWPSGARMITQYFGWRHHAIDLAGPWQTPTYAAKAGTVEVSKCGWNNGYGCYVIIDHGGGIKTLYGHHSQLLVSPGEYVTAGQTIALMGNTGKVHGVTGIHLHFEVIINGIRVNPLGYVR